MKAPSSWVQWGPSFWMRHGEHQEADRSRRNMCKQVWGLHRNLGEPAASDWGNGRAPHPIKSRSTDGDCSWSKRSAIDSRYSQAKETEQGRMGSRSRSVLIVPMKLGNGKSSRTQWTPLRQRMGQPVSMATRGLAMERTLRAILMD